MNTKLLISMTVLVLAAGAVLAQYATPNQGRFSDRDAAFVREAASSGHAEVAFGRLLRDKAQSSALQEYGQVLIDDHGRANERLASIARSMDMEVPTEPGETHRQHLDALAALSGTEFEAQARQHAIRDHEADVAVTRPRWTVWRIPPCGTTRARRCPCCGTICSAPRSWKCSRLPCFCSR